MKCIRFSQEPADQSVVLGERIVLSCVVFNYSGIVQWTKDGLALGIGDGLRGEGKASIFIWLGHGKYKHIRVENHHMSHSVAENCEIEILLL